MKKPNPAFADTSIQNLVIDGLGIKANVEELVTSARMTRTIQGASALSFTLFDPGAALLQSGLFQRRTIITLGGLLFSLVQLEKRGEYLTLTFEDRNIAMLRRHDKFMKANREEITRAEFIRKMVREEPSIQFYVPEASKAQKIAKPEEPRDEDEKREPGFANDAKLTVKNSPATAEQVSNIERVLTVGYQLGASDIVLEAAIMTIMVESEAINVNHGLDDSLGLFQQRPSQGWGTPEQVTNVEYASKTFYTRAMKIFKEQPDIAPGTLAQSVQRSKYPYKYAQMHVEAVKAIKAYRGEPDNRPSEMVAEAFEFTRGTPEEPEDTWTAANRLAQEVNWRLFMIGSVMYYVSEPWLMGTKPRQTLSESSPGVDSIDFDWDVAKKEAVLTINCRAGMWQAPPGSVVEVEDLGIANGRWLVHNIRRGDMSNPATEVECRKARPALPEPAPRVSEQFEEESAIGPLPPSFGKLYYPMAIEAKEKGSPADHARRAFGNWYSDNAWDLVAPVGTACIAMDNGVVSGVRFTSTLGGTYGWHFYLKSEKNQWWYHHMTRVVVKNDQIVTAGDVVGYTGSAPYYGPSNPGVPHLHIGQEKGTFVLPPFYKGGGQVPDDPADSERYVSPDRQSDYEERYDRLEKKTNADRTFDDLGYGPLTPGFGYDPPETEGHE